MEGPASHDKYCHLERNPVFGEAGDRMQSKDPYSVASSDAVSGNSPVTSVSRA